MNIRLYPAAGLLLTIFGLLSSCVTVQQEVPVSEITLSQNDAELIVGDILQLRAAISPDDATDKTLSWSSTVETVATVDGNGKVTAVGAGKAVILAKAGGVLAPCTVVVKPAKVDISEIKLSETSLSMEVGDEVTLVATVLPDNATVRTVLWSSSDPAVASVQDGTVLAVKEGSATITASADGIDAACLVTVRKAEVPVPEAAGIYIVGLDAYQFDPSEQQISVYSAEGSSWYRFLFPATLMMYQVGPIPDSAAVGDIVDVVMETYTSGVETAQPVNYTLELRSKDGAKMILVSEGGDMFILRY